jgi:hypothetical protein
MVKPTNKHRPFDTRYPARPTRITPKWVLQPDQELLEWDAFLARYFPGSRRHDLEPLAAYGAYRTALAKASPPKDSARPQTQRTRRRRTLRTNTPVGSRQSDVGTENLIPAGKAELIPETPRAGNSPATAVRTVASPARGVRAG